MGAVAAPTPLELVRLAAEYLAKKGVPSARLEAEVLLAHALGVRRIELYLQFDKPLAEAEVDRFRDFTRRRARREPSAYITGVREFWSLELRVDPSVLVPRPETEVLVEATLARLDEGPRTILDVGTGSGAIALGLLSERPAWRAVGVDASAGALAVSAANAERLGLSARFEARSGDLFSAVAGERFDAVVSNPPYIPSRVIEGLEPEVSRYEPREALNGGPDGLEAIRRLVAGGPEHLA
ncbi:MAG: peptide chain release factor N(5)-glutamine methyltransferase, partial [Deltaproteobacteria bacterium]|nr:peptide chain release factor N(5)-glutamine methyltransferase [Deltaproteobacteria bacterium]